MKIFEIHKNASHRYISLAIVVLLMIFPAALRADDNKNKKKDSAAAKPAASPKPSPGTNGGRGAGAGSGASNGSTGNTGGANKAGKSGGSQHNTSDSGAAQTTHHGTRTNANNNTGQTNTTSTASESHKGKKSTGGATPITTGGTGNTGATDPTGKFGKHNTAGNNTTNTVEGNSHKAGKTSGAAGSATNITIVKPGITRGPNGKVESYRGHNGSEAHFGRDGRVREVRARDMTIIHGPGGSRRIVVDRVDHSRIVAYRGGYGYVQRPFIYRNREFASRTYFYLGHPYARYYQRYPYRGLYLEGYRPYRYYRPAFYGWVYNPWRTPIRYTWGWARNPWYGYYGGYFTPYAVYPRASFWLTDYLIAASLQDAYQQRVDDQAFAFAGTNSADQVVLTPEVKQAIANEVQSQLALENSESQTVTQGGDLDINSSGLPRILADVSPSHPHVFVVAGPLEVTDSQGQQAGLTAGDVLRLSAAPSQESTSAYLEVLASKNPNCVRGTTVSIEITDLQEMQNHMRANIDQGLQELQGHQGGLPAPPPLAAAPPVEAPFAPIAPPPDANVSDELQQQSRAADTIEQSVLDEVKRADNSGNVGNSSIPTAAAVNVTLGQTTDEVVAVLGKPRRVVNLGSKRIYVYQDSKITFVNGRVTNIE